MPRQDREQKTPGKASFGATVKAVLWAFFGVRKKRDHERDAVHLNPVHVIVAGIIGAVILIVSLIVIVNIVVAS